MEYWNSYYSFGYSKGSGFTPPSTGYSGTLVSYSGLVWFPDPSSPPSPKNAEKSGGRVRANGLLLGVARASWNATVSVDEGKTLTISMC